MQRTVNVVVSMAQSAFGSQSALILHASPIANAFRRRDSMGEYDIKNADASQMAALGESRECQTI